VRGIAGSSRCDGRRWGAPRPAGVKRNDDACGYESPTRAATPACGRGEVNSELLRVDIMWSS
jgi:hypothetical protein